jgi:hypothetical protein
VSVSFVEQREEGNEKTDLLNRNFLAPPLLPPSPSAPPHRRRLPSSTPESVPSPLSRLQRIPRSLEVLPARLGRSKARIGEGGGVVAAGGDEAAETGGEEVGVAVRKEEISLEEGDAEMAGAGRERTDKIGAGIETALLHRCWVWQRELHSVWSSSGLFSKGRSQFRCIVEKRRKRNERKMELIDEWHVPRWPASPCNDDEDIG